MVREFTLSHQEGTLALGEWLVRRGDLPEATYEMVIREVRSDFSIVIMFNGPIEESK